MKFHQRIGIMTSAAGLSLVFLLVVYSPGVMHGPSGHPARRHRRTLSIDYDVNIGYVDSIVVKHQCVSPDNINKQLDNNTIYTTDLPVQSNFNLYNKHYKMPHVNIEDSNNEINVIILPHSHVDAGWLLTIEEYYVQHVKGILNNMVAKLRQYEDMTFVWAESVFLSMWWNELEDITKLQVRRLIRSGQLEIALGGWVMSDEASTHYPSVIDQLMEGHIWVTENLDTVPANSWAIDPFGHSATMSYLWKQAGMKNMVIQRVHQAIKSTLASKKSLEFNWRQIWDHTGSTDILCHIMPYVYYGMQYTCGPDWKICAMYDYGIPKSLREKSTGREVTDDNIDVQAKYLYEQYRKKAGLYKYNTILVPIGDDFRFDTSHEWDSHYRNYRKVMDYINNRNDWNMKIQFGTLKDYFNLLHKDEKKKSKYSSENQFPVLKGDFFPYSDQNSEYWTGYYSTRPFHKQLSRDIESNLRAADILTTLTYSQCKKLGVDYERHHDVASMLQEVRRNLGLFLHHDAITGTAKPLVVQNYENKLLEAYNMSQDVIGITIQNILTNCLNDDPVVISPEIYRHDANTLPARYKVPIIKQETTVILFNPVAQERNEYLTLVVDNINIEIKNSKNYYIPFQVNPIFTSTTKIHPSEFEIVFMLDMAPFSIETLLLQKSVNNPFRYWSSLETFKGGILELPKESNFMYKYHDVLGNNSFIENDNLRVNFNDKGMLTNVYDRMKDIDTKVDVDFLAYTSDGSGAYLFYPSGVAKGILEDYVPYVRLVKGPYMEQIQVVYPHLHHTVTLYDTDSGIHSQGLYIINILDLTSHDMMDREIIMRFKSDVENNDGTFYTDQNGFQLIGRKNNPRRRIETNYYPMTSMVLLEDDIKRMTLHSQQSHGVASLEQGWLELMLDRKVLNDDARGLGEGVYDNRPTVSKFILHVEGKQSSSTVKSERIAFPSAVSFILNEKFQQPIQTFFTNVRHNKFMSKFHPMTSSIPCDITIVSLKNIVNSNLVYNGTSLIVHRNNLDCDYPTSVLRCSINNTDQTITSLLPHFEVFNIRETTLTHLHTKTQTTVSNVVSIQPMELKSYLLNL
ncbi:Alpha-mannosidase 2x [Mactra antiquata]